MYEGVLEGVSDEEGADGGTGLSVGTLEGESEAGDDGDSDASKISVGAVVAGTLVVGKRVGDVVSKPVEGTAVAGADVTSIVGTGGTVLAVGTGGRKPTGVAVLTGGSVTAALGAAELSGSDPGKDGAETAGGEIFAIAGPYVPTMTPIGRRSMSNVGAGAIDGTACKLRPSSSLATRFEWLCSFFRSCASTRGLPNRNRTTAQ
jgi:hypothetical protein